MEKSRYKSILCQNRLLIAHECLSNFSLSKVSYSKHTFLTRNSLFLLETNFSNLKLTFITRNSLFLLETHFSYSKLTFSYSKLAFLTRNSLFLLETHFSYSKLAFLTRNSLPTKSESRWQKEKDYTNREQGVLGSLDIQVCTNVPHTHLVKQLDPSELIAYRGRSVRSSV